MDKLIHKLAAIMFTDIEGYSTLMGKDEQLALDLLSKNREIQIPLINKYSGTLLKELGDGTFASFPTTTVLQVSQFFSNSGRAAKVEKHEYALIHLWVIKLTSYYS